MISWARYIREGTISIIKMAGLFQALSFIFFFFFLFSYKTVSAAYTTGHYESLFVIAFL